MDIRKLRYRLKHAKNDRQRRRLRRLIALVRHRRPYLRDVQIRSVAPGPRHWGGSADLFGQFITPFMKRRGLTTSSKKRTPEHNAAIGGSPTSDHLTTATFAFAVDYPTFSGDDDARALATALGIEGFMTGSYDHHQIQVDGYAFSVQILWAVPGHYDHVHVGVEAL